MTEKNIKIELTPEEAKLICRFCKRSQFVTFRDLAQNEDEAYALRDALYAVWNQLLEEQK